MKITKVVTGQTASILTNQSSKQTLPETPKNVVPSFSDKMSACELDAIQKKMDNLETIDMAKVDSIRDALKRGELSVDLPALAKAIQQFHSSNE